jgi:hypothetical protein
MRSLPNYFGVHALINKNYTPNEKLTNGKIGEDIVICQNENNSLSNGEDIVICQNETMLSISLSLGGIVSSGGIEARWFEHSALRGVSAPAGLLSADIDPLSTAHKTPFIEWCDGASVLKVSKAEEHMQVGGGKRGIVKSFSMASRRRLMQTIGKVKRDADLPCFVTLTYPNLFPDPKSSKRHLEIFLKRLKRKFSSVGLIWKLEPQERGAPHYHMLVWGVAQDDLFQFVPFAWYEIAGGGDDKHLSFHLGLLQGSRPCVELVRSFKGVWSYASKYLGKTFEVSGWNSVDTGRFWAVVNRSNIPFGEVKISEISYSMAVHVMRYQKRFAKLKRRNYPSLTTYCNANQWINNVMGQEDEK